MKPKYWYEMSLPREINYTKSLFLTLSMGRNMLRVAQLHVNVLRLRCRNWPKCIEDRLSIYKPDNLDLSTQVYSGPFLHLYPPNTSHPHA